jgi:hypothetical protein
MVYGIPAQVVDQSMLSHIGKRSVSRLGKLVEMSCREFQFLVGSKSESDNCDFRNSRARWQQNGHRKVARSPHGCRAKDPFRDTWRLENRLTGGPVWHWGKRTYQARERPVRVHRNASRFGRFDEPTSGAGILRGMHPSFPMDEYLTFCRYLSQASDQGVLRAGIYRRWM